MKKILFTGARSGIASKVIDKIKDRYHIYVTVHTSKELDRVKEIYKNDKNIECFKLDVTSSNDRKILKDLDIDILVNNAAVEYTKDFYEKKKKDFLYTMEVNLIAPFLLSRELGKRMYDKKGGKIINISSNNSINKYDSSTLDYDASKAAFISVSNNLANYLAPYVRVNTICPGWINTRMTNDLDDIFKFKK